MTNISQKTTIPLLVFRTSTWFHSTSLSPHRGSKTRTWIHDHNAYRTTHGGSNITTKYNKDAKNYSKKTTSFHEQKLSKLIRRVSKVTIIYIDNTRLNDQNDTLRLKFMSDNTSWLHSM